MAQSVTHDVVHGQEQKDKLSSSAAAANDLKNRVRRLNAGV